MLNFKKFNAVFSAFVFLILPVFLAACSEESNERVFLSTVSPISSNGPVTVPTSHTESRSQLKADTYVILNNKNTTINGSGASFGDSVLKISESGTYYLKGSLSGHIEVSAEEGNVYLFLDGVSVESGEESAILSELEKGVLHLITVKGTGSTLVSRKNGDGEDDCTVFSEGSLIFKGRGSLAVVNRSGGGIGSEGNVTFQNGSVDIQAAQNAVSAKGNLSVLGGELAATAGKTALSAEGERSALLLSGGRTNLSGMEKCLESGADITVSGGKHEFISGKGSTGSFAREKKGVQGSVIPESSGSSLSAGKSTDSKAVDAKRNILVSGGSIYISSNADGLCAERVVSVSGGELTVRADQTAFLAEKTLSVSGGDTEIDFCSSGIKTETLYFSDGRLCAVARETAVEAEKSLLQSGGTLVALSSDGEKHSAVSCAKRCTVSGGTLFAAGGIEGLGKTSATVPSLSLECKLSGGSTLTVVQSKTAIMSKTIPFDCSDAVLFSGMLTSKAKYSIYASTQASSDPNTGVLVATVTAN